MINVNGIKFTIEKHFYFTFWFKTAKIIIKIGYSSVQNYEVNFRIKVRVQVKFRVIVRVY